MLGIVVDAASDSVGGGLIFHRFGEKTSLDRVVAACLQCEFAHKVILSMPAADRVLVNGSVFQPKLAGSFEKREFFGRGLEQIFYGRRDEGLERTYRAALNYGLSDVVYIPAENPLIPKWLINQAALTYHQNQGRVVTTENFPSGFGMAAFPFWRLAEFCRGGAMVGTVKDFLDSVANKVGVPNEPPFDLPQLNHGFALDSSNQVRLLTKIFEELDAGADIGDIMEDFIE